jgi:leucyl/phenylalanyl-tRNA--protein transferase
VLTADWEPPRGLAKTLRKPVWTVTRDRAFGEVMRACAEAPRPGQDGTWITEDFLRSYGELHRRGLAHSVEVWREGALVGGLYGVQVGRLFCGESMFHRVTDASKVAFAHLVARLREHGCPLVDCQVPTPHLMSLGALPCRRDDFLDAVDTLVGEKPAKGLWEAERGAGSEERGARSGE